MDGPTIGAVVAGICSMLTALAAGLFGWLGKRDDRARQTADRAEKDVEKLTERIDELEHRLDVVVSAYYAQRREIAAQGGELLPIPQEMRRGDAPS